MDTVRKTFEYKNGKKCNDKCFHIPPGLSENQRDTFLTEHGIPIHIEEMPIFDFAFKQEYFERWTLGKHFLYDVYAIRDNLIERIRASFSIKTSIPCETSGHAKGVYRDYSLEFVCQNFRNTLLESDAVVYYHDLRCVIFHVKKNENVLQGEYLRYFCRVGEKECMMSSISFCFKETPEELQKRLEAQRKAKLEEQLKKEKEQLGEEKFAILEEARQAAQDIMPNIPRSTRNPVGYVSVISELGKEGIHNLPRGGGPPEMSVLEAGAEAFCTILKKYGIKYNTQAVLD